MNNQQHREPLSCDILEKTRASSFGFRLRPKFPEFHYDLINIGGSQEVYGNRQNRIIIVVITTTSIIIFSSVYP